MSIWRRIRKIPALVFGGPLRMLALVVLILAAANYRTLLEGLPSSVPELEAVVADIDPVTLRLSGEVAGIEQGCWRMTFTFLDENGERLLTDTDYVLRIGQLEPATTVTIPHREAYRLRLQTEIILADPEKRCFALAGAAILRARGEEVIARGLDLKTGIHNECDFSGDSNDCTIVYR